MRLLMLSLTVALASTLGCALTVPNEELPIGGGAAAAADSSSQPRPAATAGGGSSLHPAAATSEPDSLALARAIAELQSLGPLDDELTSQLAADLERTPAHLWPQCLAQLRSKIAYQRRTTPAFPDVTPPVSDRRSPARPAGASAEGAETASATAADEPARLETDNSAFEFFTTFGRPEPDTNAGVAPNGASAASDAPIEAARTKQAPATAASGNLDKPSPSPVGHNKSPVALASASASLPADDWRNAMNGAIVALKAQSSTAGPGQREFWSKQMHALAVYLDDHSESDSPRRAARTKASLEQAAATLGELAALQLRSVAICSEVSSYGVYKTLDKNELRAGQEVIIYAEVENFRAQPTENRFHTALNSSYRILDATGRRVAEQHFPLAEENCRNSRRDFFVRYFLWLPKQIAPGHYTLELTVEDVLGRKAARSTVDFTIGAK